MLSRENRVIVGSFVLLVIAVAALAVVEVAFDVPIGQQPLLSYLLVTGLVVVTPQLYLAATDDDISARTRVRFTALAIGAFALWFAGHATYQVEWGALLEAEPAVLQEVAILAIGTAAVLGLVCYEFVAGYRSSGGNETPTGSS
ncbi:hypothetical protein AB7C87_22385 [Natrarchaeobius sp. A-rgal3]|uniref:hypothetical protein n=1 Tax=Natrarchaeobius versutus TaxID=1679078 RepID=UPI00350FE4B1